MEQLLKIQDSKIGFEADLLALQPEKQIPFLSSQVNILAKATAETPAKGKANLQRAAAISSYFNKLASMAKNESI